jgi:hypothetical protein
VCDAKVAFPAHSSSPLLLSFRNSQDVRSATCHPPWLVLLDIAGKIQPLQALLRTCRRSRP